MKKCLTLIGALSLVLSVFIGAAHPAEYTGKTVRWRFGMQGSPRIGTYAVDWFAKEVEKRSKGKMKITVQYGGVLAAFKEARDAIKSGVMDGGQVRVTKTSETPLSTVAGLPCLCLPDDAKVKDVCKWITTIYKDPVIVKEWTDRWNNMYLFPCVFTPRGIASKVKIEKMSDFKGLRLRESKVKGQPFEKAGAVLTWVGTGDLYSSLERKMIDAACYPCPSSMAAIGIGEVAEYVITGLDLSYSFNTFAINKSRYDDLPTPLRKIVDEVTAEVPEFLEKDNAKRVASDWAKLKEQGAEVIQVSPKFRADLKKLAETTYPAWVKNMKKVGISEEQAQEMLDKTLALTEELSRK